MAIPVSTEGPNSKERCAQVDLMKADDVTAIGLGAKVRIVLEGEVVALRGVEQMKYSDNKVSTYPGSLQIEVDKFKVTKLGDFDGMEDDEDEG